MSEEKMDLLFEELDKEKDSEEKVQKTFLKNIHIENLLVLFILLYIIGGDKKGHVFKANGKSPKDLYGHVSKMNHIVRDISPYFGNDIRTTLTGLELILNAVENIYGIKNGAYKAKAQAMGTLSVPKKHIRVLERIAPHLEGTGRDNAIRIIELNNRIENLKGNKTNLLKSGQEMIEILDLLNVRQAKDIKRNIHAIKTVMKMLNN